MMVGPPPTDLLTLADAKTFLNISGTQYDAELPTFVTTASDMIINRIGPVAGSPQFDEYYDGGHGNTTQIVLRHAPVSYVTSVSEAIYTGWVKPLAAQPLDGTSTDSSPYGYTIDLQDGLITRRSAGAVAPFAPGKRNIRVVYSAGYASIPPELVMAGKILVKHLWETRRGGAKRPGLGGNDEASLKDEGDFPARVEEILANFYIPGIA
jgi:uncharacterized phiE125 gp8 family phage protein